jgi:hypothetical protein
MQDPFSQSQEPLDDEENAGVSCQLVIQCDTDGVVGYDCNWLPGDSGIVGLASIFYKLLIDNFGEEIFEEIKKDCVLNNNEADYLTVVNLINNRAEQVKQDRQTDDDVVVPPDQVFPI